jgi:hypothetical protein
VCPNCSRLVGLDWSLCAWCGKDFERRESAAAIAGSRPAQITPLPGTIDDTGRIAKASVDAASARQGRGPVPRTLGRAPGTARTSQDVLPES